MGKAGRDAISDPDARIIAAAPDLLAALKALMPSAPCDGSCREGAGCAWTLARAAIAKAEGA